MSEIIPKHTGYFFVDSLDEFRAYLERIGAEILLGPNKVPSGWNMTVRHLDGVVVEYVEHTKKFLNTKRKP